jgi:hypothetical protein
MSEPAPAYDPTAIERAQEKLQAFYDALPEDEREVITAVLVRGKEDPPEDAEVVGFSGPMFKVKIDAGMAAKAGLSLRSMGSGGSGGGGGGSSAHAPAPAPAPAPVAPNYWWWVPRWPWG